MHVRFFMGFLMFVLLASPQVAQSQTDSEKTFSQADLERKLLADRISDLEKKLEEKEALLKELQEEKLKVHQNLYDSLKARLGTYFLILTLATAIIGWIGWKNVKQYINIRAVKLTQKKLDEKLTDAFIASQITEKGQAQIEQILSDIRDGLSADAEKITEKHRREFEVKLKEMTDKFDQTHHVFAEKAERRLDELDRLKEGLMANRAWEVPNTSTQSGLGGEVSEGDSQGATVKVVSIPRNLDRPNLRQFEEILENAKQEGDYSSDDWFWKGVSERDTQKYRQALHSFTQAIRLNSKVDLYWNNLGYARKQLGDFSGAVSDYSEAIKLNPSDPVFWNNRGGAKSELGNFQGAILDFDKAISIDSTNDIFWCNRGNAKDDLMDFIGAISDYDKAIELDSSNAIYLNNRAHSKLSIKDYQGAYKDFSYAIDLDPDDSDFWTGRGGASNLLGDSHSSIEDCSKALQLNPENANAWNNRGHAKNNIKNYKDAIFDFENSIKINPESPNPYAHRAFSFINLDKLGQSEKDIQRALELKSDYDRAHHNLGLLHQKQGRTEEACEAWKKALELGFEEAQEMLDKHCTEDGNSSED